jgi:alcohol dehydrogenase
MASVRAAVFRAFGGPLAVEQVNDPEPPPDGVVVRVEANGLCRSDWHAWAGHDPDIRLPHVPGHELAGVVVATGPGVTHWREGARVTSPFVLGCGRCPRCAAGQQQVCDDQYQPGFHGWGSLAEFVPLPRADANLVALPDGLRFDAAASLGCRFATSFRAVVDQARIRPGQWLAVHGCGGVGLSAVMIAAAAGAQVIAVDVDADALALAREVGADHVVLAPTTGPGQPSRDDVVPAILDLTGGGADASIDAVGSTASCVDSIRCLRTHGRHVQVGLMVGDHATPAIPIGLLHAREITLVGSHGMAAWQYPRMLDQVAAGRLDPGRLVTSRLSLTEAARWLPRMADPGRRAGMAVVTDLAGTSS